jgi:hypothetical protein
VRAWRDRLMSAPNWAQPSTAAAATLAVIAANVCSSATTRAKRRSLKRTDITSLFSLISERRSGVRDQEREQGTDVRDQASDSGCVEPGNRAQPSDWDSVALDAGVLAQGFAGLQWVR